MLFTINDKTYCCYSNFQRILEPGSEPIMPLKLQKKSMRSVLLLSLKNPKKSPNPQLYLSPMRSLKSKLAVIPKILNRQKFLKSCRLNFFILIQISITVNFSYVYVINYKITHWKKVVVFILGLMLQVRARGCQKNTKSWMWPNLYSSNDAKHLFIFLAN